MFKWVNSFFVVILLVLASVTTCSIRKEIVELNKKSDQIISNVINMQKPFWEKWGK